MAASTWSTLTGSATGSSYTATGLSPTGTYDFSVTPNSPAPGGTPGGSTPPDSGSGIGTQPYDMSQSVLDGSWTCLGFTPSSANGGPDACHISGPDDDLTFTNQSSGWATGALSGGSITISAAYDFPFWPNATVESGNQRIDWDINGSYWVRDTGVPTVGISTGTSAVNEGTGFGTTFSWSGGTPGTSVTVPFDFSGGTAAIGTDFNMQSSFTFQSGTSGSIPLAVTTTNDGTPGWTKVIDAAIKASVGGLYIISTTNPDYKTAIDNTDLGVTLGGGTSGIILEGNGSGMDNLTALHLSAPSEPLVDATVTLSTTDTNLEVWDTPTPDSSSTPLIHGAYNSYTWTYGSGMAGSGGPPDTLYVGVIGGSTTVGDVKFKLQDSDVGLATGVTGVAGSTANTVYSNTGTAITIGISTASSGGQIVDLANDRTENTTVGANTMVSADVQAPAVWKAAAQYQWTVPGNTLYQYIQDNNYAATIPLQQENNTDQLFGPAKTGLAQNTVQFFWVTSHLDEKDRVSVRATINGNNYTSETTYNVYSANVTVKLAGGTTIGGTIAGANNTTIPEMQLFHPPNEKGGINIQSTVTLPHELPELKTGQWAFTQTVKPNRIINQPNGVINKWSQNGLTILDNNTFYPFIVSGNAEPFDTGKKSETMYDSPRLDVGVPTKVADQFFAYIMFCPRDGNWVPAAVVEWNWTASASQQLNSPLPTKPQSLPPDLTLEAAEHEPIYSQSSLSGKMV